MAFAAATKRAAVASRRALKVHQATAQALLQTAWAVPIALPDLPEQALRAAAEERLRGALAGQSPLPIGLEHLVAGYAVQILLERCERSLYSLDEAFSASGVRLARAVVRKRVLVAIAGSCVWLRQECARRFRAERGSAWGERGRTGVGACLNAHLRYKLTMHDFVCAKERLTAIRRPAAPRAIRPTARCLTLRRLFLAAGKVLGAVALVVAASAGSAFSGIVVYLWLGSRACEAPRHTYRSAERPFQARVGATAPERQEPPAAHALDHGDAGA